MNKKIILFTFAALVLLLMIYKNKNSKNMPTSNTIIVGTNAEYPPFCFVENDKIVGFDIDIANEVAKRLGKKIEIKDMSWEALIPELLIGKVHFGKAENTTTRL